MLSLFAAAAAGSGVAQAQECIARAKNTGMVRAEGITEVVAEIELRCRRPEAGRFGFAADIPEELKIAVELNTRITNAIGDDAVVKLETAPLTYESGGIDLVAHKADSNQPITDDKFTDGELSDDGNAIEWTEIPADGVNLNPETASQKGFNLVIKGLRANASALGDGEDITATVLVGGTAVHSAPLKVADVTTGLQVTADAAELLRCADDATAAIKIQEGFANAIMSAASTTDDRLVVTFTGIPEGLKVMVPDIVPLATDDPDTTADEAAASFSLDLMDEGRTSGVGKIEDNMGEVELSATGAGEVVYNLADTASTLDDERVELPVTFVRESEDDPPTIGRGRVTVSFHPVSGVGGDTFEVGAAPLPRFVKSAKTAAIIEVDACATTLLFPHVFHQSGFDTGIAISNTSPESGSCAINYHGAGGPDHHESPLIAGGGQLIFTLSSTVDTTGFQGYLVAVCDFRKAYGFALILDGFGEIASTLGLGYLAVRNPWNKQEGPSRSSPAREKIALRARLKTIGEPGSRSGFPISFLALQARASASKAGREPDRSDSRSYAGLQQQRGESLADLLRAASPNSRHRPRRVAGHVPRPRAPRSSWR